MERLKTHDKEPFSPIISPGVLLGDSYPEKSDAWERLLCEWIHRTSVSFGDGAQRLVAVEALCYGKA